MATEKGKAVKKGKLPVVNPSRAAPASVEKAPKVRAYRPEAAGRTAKLMGSWSYSRFSDYQQCPLKAKLKHIDKVKEPPNDAMARGAAIGETAEKYIKGEIPGTPFPPELLKFKAEFLMLRKQYAKKQNGMAVEETWAFTKDWTETQWNDWVGCWVRIKIDCGHHEDGTTFILTDWKTGKFYEPDAKAGKYAEQLELYAIGVLLLYPHVEMVKPRLGYLDQGFFYPRPSDPAVVFTRQDLPELLKRWNKRVGPMMTDTIFAPRPNDKCKWCHFRASNKAAGGGQCKF